MYIISRSCITHVELVTMCISNVLDTIALVELEFKLSSLIRSILTIQDQMYWERFKRGVWTHIQIEGGFLHRPNIFFG